MSEFTTPQTTAEIIVRDGWHALVMVDGQIVYLVDDILCADCGHPITGREIDPAPKVKS